MSLMNFGRSAVMTGWALALAACQTHNSDARFDAGWRPSKAYCAFGGETERLAAYCARVNFGPEGALSVLRAENTEILEAQDSRLRCTDHVERAKAAVGTYGDYQVARVYSCDDDAPIEAGRRVCHVSLLVTDSSSGERFVMDNGFVLDPSVTGGVATYADFRGRVDHAWSGAAPAWAQLGSE